MNIVSTRLIQPDFNLQISFSIYMQRLLSQRMMISYTLTREVDCSDFNGYIFSKMNSISLILLLIIAFPVL